MPANPLVPIHIEVGGAESKKYKSIDHVIWENVPPFAVLTGLNGSGKTQLLEVIAYRLTNTWHPQLGDLSGIHLSITGDEFGPDAVAFVPSRWDIAGAAVLGIAQMQKAKQQLFENLSAHNVRHDVARRAMRARLERLLGVANLDDLGQEEFVRRLPDDFAFMLEEANVTSGLTHVFLAYRLRMAESLESGVTREEVLRNLGPAPWDVVNDTLRVAEFPYRVISPIGSKLLDPYELLLEDIDSGARVRPIDLSSGEKVLLGLVLWLYNSQQHGRFPRLFLLDEPDAHLHPSMTRHLLNVIREVLVDRYGVRTILTTHSPSTVALAPETSVFEMSRTSPRITPSGSHASTIGLLTAGLVTVSPTTRYVLVEDEEDVAFYDTVREILTDFGPSRDPRAIKPAPSIVFLPASIGAGKSKTAGGRTIVKGWVEKFDRPPLDQLVRGIVDRDTNNAPTRRVAVLGRYSIENYLLDPFVVYGLLLDHGSAPTVPSVTISRGDEHRLRSLEVALLQGVVDVIAVLTQPHLRSAGQVSDIPLKNVTFTSGKSVTYPAWMLDTRGHDLLLVYQQAFGGPSVINAPRLRGAFRRVRLVPVELADILDGIQA